MRVTGIVLTGDALVDGLAIACAALVDMVDRDLDDCDNYYYAGVGLVNHAALKDTEASSIGYNLNEIAKKLRARRQRLDEEAECE